MAESKLLVIYTMHLGKVASRGPKKLFKVMVIFYIFYGSYMSVYIENGYILWYMYYIPKNTYIYLVFHSWDFCLKFL